jgi:hypothetical protein
VCGDLRDFVDEFHAKEIDGRPPLRFAQKEQALAAPNLELNRVVVAE